MSRKLQIMENLFGEKFIPISPLPTRKILKINADKRTFHGSMSIMTDIASGIEPLYDSYFLKNKK